MKQLSLLLLLPFLPILPARSATELGIRETRFTLNGQPTFLLGASYYGALGAPEDFIRRDLDDLQRHGFNWIRVWATWAAFDNDVSAVDGHGEPRPPYLRRLTDLVAACDRRGIVVDVTLSRGNGIAGSSRLQDLGSHRRAVETLVTTLRPWRNWYLDLGNERSIRDARFVSLADLRELRAAIRALDPDRLVTASHAGADLTRDEVREYLLEAGLDFLAPHRPRRAGTAEQTAAKTREALHWMHELGHPAPLHYQEPFRRAYGNWQPTASDFTRDLEAARQAGAAGWCFHNGDARGQPNNEPRRSFDLRRHRLFDQLDEEERAFLATLTVRALDPVASSTDARIDSPEAEDQAPRLRPSAMTPSARPQAATERRRLIIETDAGGDPDDEQSLVRFLLYANEWDIDGIIANRPQARPGENRNRARTGLGIVRQLLDAYAACWPSLVQHDPRYPEPDTLRARTVAGYNHTHDAVELLISAIDDPDPRPVWYSDWGTDHGSATNNLRRALDRVRRERGRDGYARFKSRIRLVSADKFGPHTRDLAPPFPLCVDTWRPELEGRRWYHQFSAITARAGGFDLVRDCLTGHGPLGALYPTNTTHPQKEGDTLSFLYLVPNGLNAPEHPGWGGWGGRLGHQPDSPPFPYYWANQADTWNGTHHRDHTLRRWAADLQNDFRARLTWCVSPFAKANHPPQVRPDFEPQAVLTSGERQSFSAATSADPDGDRLTFDWIPYPEVGTYQGPLDFEADGAQLSFTAPEVTAPESVHFILRVSDHGTPPLSRYARLALTLLPRDPQPASKGLPEALAPFSSPPSELAHDFGSFGTLLGFDDGRPVGSPADWPERRHEIRAYWNEVLGPWPPLLEAPRLEVLTDETRENLVQQRVRVPIAPGQSSDGILLRPFGLGPFPAVLVVFYDPETSAGLKTDRPHRDFALQLARAGFLTLSIGTPGGDAWKPDLGEARCQPLAFHAYVAANCWRVLAAVPQVDPRRIGVTGHSYGGKWALFAAALWEPFAAVAVSDPGIVFDESRSNVNYWEPWYLGADASTTRQPGIPSAENPRTGAYARLIADGRDLHQLHALIAPRPFLVSGGAEDPPERWRALNHTLAVNALLGRPNRVVFTHRPAHAPTPESNAQLVAFFKHFLTP